MLKTFYIKGVGILVKEATKVNAGQVTSRVIQEHVFAAGVRCPDGATFRAGMPFIDSSIVLCTRIGATPGGIVDLVP